MTTVEELRKKLLADLDVLVAEAVRAGVLRCRPQGRQCCRVSGSVDVRSRRTTRVVIGAEFWPRAPPLTRRRKTRNPASASSSRVSAAA